jgi:ABC-type Fe3+/spermidine/putrescine transport system ATPase subunit
MTAGHEHKPFIEVKNLSAAYDDKVVVHDVSFSVAEGEHLSLLGPSGCGKSTLLRCIAGLETPLRGEITIDSRTMFSSERKINVPSQNRALAMVFQSYAIWPHMTVCENVAYGLRVKGVNRKDSRAAALKALEMVGMAELIDRPATELSGGQQQRVAVARSLAPSPKAILLDEPLSNLDARLRMSMREELKDLQVKLKLSTVYVTHDQEEAMAMSDRIIVMKAGEIEQEGHPLEIYAKPRTRFVADFIGASNVLEGAVSSVGNSHASLKVGRIEIQCDAPTDGPPLTPGQNCLAAVRTIYPQLSATANPDLKNQWPATVASRTFLGDIVKYSVDFGGGELRIQSSPLSRFEQGQKVFVHIAPEHASLIRV